MKYPIKKSNNKEPENSKKYILRETKDGRIVSYWYTTANGLTRSIYKLEGNELIEIGTEKYNPKEHLN